MQVRCWSMRPMALLMLESRMFICFSHITGSVMLALLPESKIIAVFWLVVWILEKVSYGPYEAILTQQDWLKANSSRKAISDCAIYGQTKPTCTHIERHTYMCTFMSIYPYTQLANNMNTHIHSHMFVHAGTKCVYTDVHAQTCT